MEVTFTVNDERVNDLLTSAFEGGSTYWCELVSVVRPKGKNKGKYLQDIPFLPGGVVILKDKEESGLNAETFALDRSSLETGLQTMANKFPYHFGLFMDENDDAETADVFLQCCLFGEVIYGYI